MTVPGWPGLLQLGLLVCDDAQLLPFCELCTWCWCLVFCATSCVLLTSCSVVGRNVWFAMKVLWGPSGAHSRTPSLFDQDEPSNHFTIILLNVFSLSFAADGNVLLSRTTICCSRSLHKTPARQLAVSKPDCKHNLYAL